MRLPTFILYLGFTVFLFACARQPTNIPPLSQGVQEVSGYLSPAELSLIRRGTHLLLHEGVEIYFVESKVIALQEFEGKEVTLRGTLEYNTDQTSLPVLVVEELSIKEPLWKKVSIQSMGLTMEIPPEWNIEKTEGDEVRLIPLSSTKAIVRISNEDQPIPSGTPIRIGDRSGVRVLNEQTGEQEISVHDRDSVVFITFIPQDSDRLLEERTAFLRVLQSIEWQVSSNESNPSSSSKEYGAPCGGVAGVLCPNGFYCEIMAFKEGIGRCVKI